MQGKLHWKNKGSNVQVGVQMIKLRAVQMILKPLILSFPIYKMQVVNYSSHKTNVKINRDKTV